MIRYVLALLVMIVSLGAFAQSTGFKAGSGGASAQQNGAGKILFSSKEVLPNTTSAETLQQPYLFTPKSSLYMTAFFERSLTNNLKQLTPDAKTAEITELGSLHFSFYVDDQLVYQDKLHPASLYPQQKDTLTFMSWPLTVKPFANQASCYLWLRFLKNGGDSALTIGKHLFKMEIRPYIQNSELKIGELMASGQVMLDVQRPNIDPATVQLNKVKAYNGLTISNEAFDATKIKELKAKEQEDVFKDISSVVVLKNSKLLIEEYFNGADRNTLHDVRSVGKTFASTMTGIAIGEGYLKNENQTLSEFYNLKNFAHYTPQKEAVRLKDLLTMSSIFEGNDNNGRSAGNEENMYPTNDWVKFALDLPIDTNYANGEWHYFTAGVVVLGDIIHKSVPGGLEKYADEKLFKPLGITQYKWQYTPQKVANTAGGIRLSSLDFAKYAQLYKNGGVWNGKRLIAKSWVDKSFTKHKAIPGRQNEYYGYLFWNKTYTVNGKQYETFYCAGNGGNHIYIFKDLPIVVVVTASAYGRPYAHAQVSTMMQDYILPAVIGVK